jgi:hypothetical protein
MNEYFSYFIEKFGPTIDPIFPTPPQIASYAEAVPQSLVEFWSQCGWGGYSEGLVWSTDPGDLSSAVSSWLDGTELLAKDQYVVVARSAFGKLFLWGKHSGVNIRIDPLSSLITTSPPNARISQGKSDLVIGSFFHSLKLDSLDFEDTEEKGLFKRALKKLGRLKSDEMYAFEPALAMGGMPRIESIVKVKMEEQLILLAQITEPEILHIDVSRHV